MQTNRAMRLLRILLSMICFCGGLLICAIVFIGATYFILGGKKSTGSLVIIVSISSFILSVVISGFAAVKLFLMTKDWSSRTNVVVFILALLLMIATLSSIQIFKYVAI